MYNLSYIGFKISNMIKIHVVKWHAEEATLDKKYYNYYRSVSLF